MNLSYSGFGQAQDVVILIPSVKIILIISNKVRSNASVVKKPCHRRRKSLLAQEQLLHPQLLKQLPPNLAPRPTNNKIWKYNKYQDSFGLVELY